MLRSLLRRLFSNKLLIILLLVLRHLKTGQSFLEREALLNLLMRRIVPKIRIKLTSQPFQLITLPNKRFSQRSLTFRAKLQVSTKTHLISNRDLLTRDRKIKNSMVLQRLSYKSILRRRGSLVVPPRPRVIKRGNFQICEYLQSLTLRKLLRNKKGSSLQAVVLIQRIT